MEKNIRAANAMELAQPLNLQLFNDFEYEATTYDEPTETVTEEATEPTETIEEIEQAEPTEEPEVQGEPPQNITQTQAFAKRLKEETEKARQEAVDAEYARLYGEQYGIYTKADYDRAIEEQEEQEIRNRYGEEEAQEIIDALRFKQENQPLIEQQREKERLFSEWTELTEAHEDIKDFSQIPTEAWQLSADKGIPLLDAYNRTLIKNQKTLIEKTRLETEQETIRKINNNVATSAGSAASSVTHQTKPVSEMTAEEFSAYRDEVKNRRRE